VMLSVVLHKLSKWDHTMKHLTPWFGILKNTAKLKTLWTN
jgi:hypothetical protein